MQIIWLKIVLSKIEYSNKTVIYAVIALFAIDRRIIRNDSKWISVDSFICENWMKIMKDYMKCYKHQVQWNMCEKIPFMNLNIYFIMKILTKHKNENGSCNGSNE